ncbi:hypothetical protein ElyMa_000191200 [Elysia marginata]|uniref:Uncharacterized protein n=1 Tax=Elysia marginata TaxID=1093978 RepID=A0AAV4EV21_9GAST|nr:hypothetical protein ElyMa_000191200 [Elysia marginata]
MPGLSSLGPACMDQWVAFLDLRIPEERHQAFLPECEENPQNPQQNAMFKYINKTYELGRRLVKGPRHSSVHQARGDKFATGTIQPSTPRREKRPKARIKEINILQLNICGITKKKTELAKILYENKPKGYKAKPKHQAIRPTAKKGRTSKLSRSSTGPPSKPEKNMQQTSKGRPRKDSLIKRLASTSWGSDMDTLRSLYLGYVRSVLDYNLCLQASSSKTV